MKYLFELSKEHKSIPSSEIFASLTAEEIRYKIIKSTEDVLIIETDSKKEKLKKLANRLSFTYYIDKLLFFCSNSTNEIKKLSNENNIVEKGSIAIKYKNRSKNISSQSIVKVLAESYTKNRKVILKNPDIEIRVLITDPIIYVGIKIADVNRSQFEDRKVQNRPYFSPISLHPKIARALVNLSSIKKKENLLDPFCGTGGILIEAGLIGVKIIGSDIEEKMIKGCKKNLDFYNIKNYRLFCCDIGKIKKHVSKIDAIITDLPYGKSTTTKGEKREVLYDRAFQCISNLLKDKGTAVIGLSDKNLIQLGKKYFNLLERHSFYVHKSLKRYFVVFKK